MEISTPALPLTLSDVFKNIIKDVTFQPKIVSGTVSTMRHVSTREMRAAANFTLKPVRDEGRSERDYKFIYKSGASRNCTNRV